MSLYDKNFYDLIADGSIRSAEKVVPLVMDIFRPNRIVDFGCGTGAWLHTFKKHGVERVLGLDSSDDGHSLLSDDEFELIDLGSPYVPLYKYDLAISLEVAEHIAEDKADNFVKNIARSSDNILWSAAVPGQRGLNHINEQWPSYWIAKFKDLGFNCNGSFRYQFWFDEEIETWYRQNILLFSRTFQWNEEVRDLVHYNNYSNYSSVESKFRYDN
jgi:SAM-dependent methyltransferase